MTELGEFQQSMEAIYGERDRARGVPATVAWLAEEVGELAKAARKGTVEEQRHELGDVLAWLASLANQLGLSLEDAAARVRVRVSALRRDAVCVPVSLLVVTGPPGSGKSTVAALVADRLPRSVLVEGDAFFDVPAPGRDRAVAARVTCAERDRRRSGGPRHRRGSPATTRRSTTASSGPGSSTRSSPQRDSTHSTTSVLLPDADVCVDRVMTRVGHGFRDEAAARKMHHEFSRAEIDARHVIVNHSTAEDAADEITARWEAGELTLGS